MSNNKPNASICACVAKTQVFKFTFCSLYQVSGLFNVYRVSGLSCPQAGGCKPNILRGFLDVFSLFAPCKVGAISFRYSWTTGIIIKFRNLILKKGHISGLAQIDRFSDFLVLGVANFRINYLRQFSFNFENSCAHLAANFLNFSKHTQLFTFGWFWRKLWTNNQKNWILEKCQFEQILKSNLYSA